MPDDVPVLGRAGIPRPLPTHRDGAARWAAICNMPVTQRMAHGDLATTSFDRSPKMPTYLLELTVGDLRQISSERDGVALNVWAVRGQEQQGATALANAQTDPG